MSEGEKGSIKEYFFVAISFIVVGIILIIIGEEIFRGFFMEHMGFWGLVISPLIGSTLEVSGVVCILLLPILSWYTIRKADKLSIRSYIFSVLVEAVGFIVMGIILVIIGWYIVFELGLGEGLLGKISFIMGNGIRLLGDGCIIFSPIISWYSIHGEMTEQKSGD